MHRTANVSSAPKANHHVSASIRDGLAYLPLYSTHFHVKAAPPGGSEYGNIDTLSFCKRVGMGAQNGLQKVLQHGSLAGENVHICLHAGNNGQALGQLGGVRTY